MAKLYFRYGAMNSGKSTALMQVAHNYEEQGMKVLILKPQVDTKGGGELVSRLGVRRKADLLIPPELDVFEAVKAANAASGPLACVLCDESQFFTPEQAEQELNLIVDHGGRVKNISISHRVYGRITAEMDIRSRQDVQEFLQALAGGASTVLSTATDGYHYHLVEAATPDRLDLIGQALQDAGFLAPLQPWEKEK